MPSCCKVRSSRSRHYSPSRWHSLHYCNTGELSPDVVTGHSVARSPRRMSPACYPFRMPPNSSAGRGRLMAGLPPGGVMVAVAASEAEVAPLLTDDVNLAAVNGPHAMVISGADAPVTVVAEQLAQSGRRTHRLAVSARISFGPHGTHARTIRPTTDRDFGRTTANRAGVQPDWTAGRNRLRVARNIGSIMCAQPVRFADGVRAAESLGGGVFPGSRPPVVGLTAAVQQSLITDHPICVVTLAKDRPEDESALAASRAAVRQRCRRGLACGAGRRAPRRPTELCICPATVLAAARGGGIGERKQYRPDPGCSSVCWVQWWKGPIRVAWC